MRPFPNKKHHWAVLILLAVAAVNTWLSRYQSELTGVQANLLAEVYKQDDPSMYPSDYVFGPTGPGAAWRLHLPAWQALLRTALHLGGGDPLNAFRLVGAVTLLLYLLSMYVLLYRQTHSTSAATFVAALSMAIFSYRRAFWGAGPLFAATPETLFLAAAPLLAQAFLRCRRKPTVLLVFFIAGVMGNLDFASSVNLVLVMLVAMLGLGRFAGRTWALAGASGVAALVGQSPAIVHYWSAFRSTVSLEAVDAGTLRQAVEAAGLNVLYPQVLIELVRWLPVAALLALPAALILTRAGRYRLPDLGGWLWLMGAAFVVAFGLLLPVQLIAWSLGTLPTGVQLFDALRLAMLPLYVLFAHSMVHLIRATRTHRAWVKAAMGLFLAVYLGSSYNTLTLRHLLQEQMLPPGEGERADRRDEDRAELRAIGQWALRETPRHALFVAQREEIRLFGQRSLLAVPSDFRYLQALSPGRLREWVERLNAQRRLLSLPGVHPKAEDIAAFVSEWLRPADQPVYMVVQTENAPAGSGWVEEVSPERQEWGRHWRVYRILPAQAASTSSSAATRPEGALTD